MGLSSSFKTRAESSAVSGRRHARHRASASDWHGDAGQYGGMFGGLGGYERLGLASPTSPYASQRQLGPAHTGDTTSSPPHQTTALSSSMKASRQHRFRGSAAGVAIAGEGGALGAGSPSPATQTRGSDRQKGRRLRTFNKGGGGASQTDFGATRRSAAALPSPAPGAGGAGATFSIGVKFEADAPGMQPRPCGGQAMNREASGRHSIGKRSSPKRSQRGLHGPPVEPSSQMAAGQETNIICGEGVPADPRLGASVANEPRSMPSATK